ncbi:hypothetical protein OH764_09375 [Burkholderia sp. M6-3]
MISLETRRAALDGANRLQHCAVTLWRRQRCVWVAVLVDTLVDVQLAALSDSLHGSAGLTLRIG